MSAGPDHGRNSATRITGCMTDGGIANWEQSLHPENSRARESLSEKDWVGIEVWGNTDSIVFDKVVKWT